MKILVVLALALTSSVAKAETILSLATKQSVSQQSSSVTSGTTVQKNSQDVITSSMGLLLQGVVAENVVLGIGFFQDSTGMASIGYRFK